MKGVLGISSWVTRKSPWWKISCTTSMFKGWRWHIRLPYIIPLSLSLFSPLHYFSLSLVGGPGLYQPSPLKYISIGSRTLHYPPPFPTPRYVFISIYLYSLSFALWSVPTHHPYKKISLLSQHIDMPTWPRQQDVVPREIMVDQTLMPIPWWPPGISTWDQW